MEIPYPFLVDSDFRGTSALQKALLAAPREIVSTDYPAKK
jgi:hypothetical protein